MSTSNKATRVTAQGESRRDLVQMDFSSVFGTKFPEDVIAPIRVAEQRLTWLEHLFNCIATDPMVGLRAKSLAEMGRYVASDAAELADGVYGDMLNAIHKGGAA